MNICKELREAMNLTVTGCAKKMGVAVPTLKLYENGGDVTDRTIAKIADFFDVTVAQLEGKETLNIPLWKRKMDLVEAEKEQASSEQSVSNDVAGASVGIIQQPALYQMGIVQVIKTSHAAVNYYLEEGWILLDTAPMKDEDDDGFFCLIGNTEFWSQQDFERVKKKNNVVQKSYWMTR